MAKTSSLKYTYAVGRRKSSVATVKLYSGKGSNTVNTKPVNQYFAEGHADIRYLKPFKLTGTDGKFYFTAKIIGGGKAGQLESLVLALSRALKTSDEAAHKPALRAAGLLTVDSRVRQRRMVGTGGKARRKKQSPKR